MAMVKEFRVLKIQTAHQQYTDVEAALTNTECENYLVSISREMARGSGSLIIEDQSLGTVVLNIQSIVAVWFEEVD